MEIDSHQLSATERCAADPDSPARVGRLPARASTLSRVSSSCSRSSADPPVTLHVCHTHTVRSTPILVPVSRLSTDRSGPDVLIVSLLDGHVVALDQHTGRIVWTFDSGAPLVSAKQSLASSQGLNVFPGTDGGLYAYHGLTHLNPGLEVRGFAKSV